MRINKFLSETGFCSRREADRLIEERRVKVNGRFAVIGQEVKDTDTIKVDGNRLKLKKKKHYIAFNKPEGIICTSDTSIRNNIIDYIGYEDRIFTVGRLDKDSKGLILLTSDGDLVNEVLSAKNLHQKEYEVVVKPNFRETDIEKMINGVKIYNPVKDKKVIAKAYDVEKLEPNKIKIILHSGLNRQIRRMLDELGYEVLELKRTRIMHIKLGKIKEGEYRHLSVAEVRGLFSKNKNAEN